jgi:hypothetical protein
VNALEDAHRLLSRRAHRKTVINRCEEAIEQVRVAHTNESTKAVFGVETDPDVVEVLRQVEADLGWCVERLKRYNNEEARGTTDDRNDPRLTRGVDDEPVPQAAAYLVLSEEERARGFVRPVRLSYVHEVCGGETRMGRAIAETYARDPYFYGGTYCVFCCKHRPVGPNGEFVWDDGTKVGT